MEFPEEEEIENGFLPVRMEDDYDHKDIYVVNVKKLLSMIDALEERIEELESEIRRMRGSEMEKQTAKQMVRFISNRNLKICVDEIIDFHNTGVLKTGLVREFANEVVINMGDVVKHYKLKIAEDVILMEAATRFSEML